MPDKACLRAQRKDKFLVEKFQQGDNKAFDELVRKYQSKIYNLAYHFTHNVDDALELSQEIFLRAFKSLRNFRQQSHFYTWLYRIARNFCIDYTRHQKVCLKTVPLAEETYSKSRLSNTAWASPSKLVETEELRHEIAKAVEMLPPREKNAFILRYYEGLDLKNIAEILECKVGTVKAHLSHGRSKLKNLLSPYLER